MEVTKSGGNTKDYGPDLAHGADSNSVFSACASLTPASLKYGGEGGVVCNTLVQYSPAQNRTMVISRLKKSDHFSYLSTLIRDNQ